MKLSSSWIGVLLFFPACTDSTKPSGQTSGSSEPPALVKPEPITELTAEQISKIEVLAKAYTAAISENDIKGAWSHWDTDIFWTTAMSGLDLSDAEKENQKDDSMREIGHGFVGTLSKSRYQFRHIRIIDGEARFLCRMLAENEGINYHDHILRFDEDGSPKIVDIYVYLSGERFSDSIRTTSAMVLSQRSSSPIGKLLGKKGEEEVFEKMQKVISLSRMGMHSQSIESYESLPENYRHNKVTFLVYLQSCMALATTENAAPAAQKRYLDAITSYKTTYPGDPSLALVSLDYWFLTENWNELIKSVEELDESVGPDSNNLFFLAFAKRQLDQPEEALALAEKAVEVEPGLEETWHAVLESALLAGKFVRSSEALAKLEKEFDFIFSLKSMQSEPMYEAFLSSDAGKTWAEQHPEK